MTQTAMIFQWILENLFLISAPSFCRLTYLWWDIVDIVRFEGRSSSHHIGRTALLPTANYTKWLLKPCNKFLIQITTYSNRSRLSARVEALVKRWLRNLWRLFLQNNFWWICVSQMGSVESLQGGNFQPAHAISRSRHIFALFFGLNKIIF